MTLFRWLGRDPFFLPYKPGKFKTASPLSFLIDCIFFPDFPIYRINTLIRQKAILEPRLISAGEWLSGRDEIPLF